jgi:hypothetical protein
MEILVKIVEISQFQMGVKTREPIMHSGFFHLKHTYIIGKQKKIYMESFCRGLSHILPEAISALKLKVPKIPFGTATIKPNRAVNTHPKLTFKS